MQALDVVSASPDHIELDEVSADDPFAAKVFAVDDHQIIRGYVLDSSFLKFLCDALVAIFVGALGSVNCALNMVVKRMLRHVFYRLL